MRAVSERVRDVRFDLIARCKSLAQFKQTSDLRGKIAPQLSSSLTVRGSGDIYSYHLFDYHVYRDPSEVKA